MKNYLENLVVLPSLYLSVTSALNCQRNFIKKNIAPEIAQIKLANDGSLQEDDFAKINNYYALAVPAILGETFCILRNKSMTLQERSTLTYLGAATGLFDDLFDKNHTSHERIMAFINQPREQLATTTLELLFIRFYQKVLAHANHKSLVKGYIDQVYASQVLSMKQLDPAIDKIELTKITFQKGGVSLLLYRSAMNDLADENEEKMIYQLGSLFQLENDLFDVYKDARDGIQTLTTIETKIHHLRLLYLSLLKEQQQLIANIDYSSVSKKRFSQYISLITFRGLVCLDFLEEKEKLSNNIFNIKKYSRKELICDMEKPRSILKLINYYASGKYKFN